MKNRKIKDEVAKGLARILISLRISKPSRRTRSYLKKVTKKLSKRLNVDARRGMKKVKAAVKPTKGAVKKKRSKLKS